jgi:hypothetical protein
MINSLAEYKIKNLSKDPSFDGYKITLKKIYFAFFIRHEVSIQ